MPFNESSMDSFGSLARAIGLTNSSGTTNGAWFEDPVGGTTGNPHGLKTVLADDDQRNALITFVDEVLGPPALHSQGKEQRQRWIPLFDESNPNITVYAVLEPVGDEVRIGVGVEHVVEDVTGTPPKNVKTTVHVPIFRVPRGSEKLPTSDGSAHAWSLLGTPGGRIVVSVDALFDPGPPTPGEAFLGGVSVSLGIPTVSLGTSTVSPGTPTSADDKVEFSLTLKDLQLPGATTPQSRTLDVDSFKELGTDVFEFITGIIRQQIDSLTDPDEFRHIMGLAGVLGLRHIDSLPPLPIADLAGILGLRDTTSPTSTPAAPPAQGLRALLDWIEAILNSDTAPAAWLGELGKLVGGTVDSGRNAVKFKIGDARLVLGLRVTPGAGGHPVLVPWVELGWSPAAGAELTATVDILRADTATGHVQAVPGLRAQAVFGAEAPNSAGPVTPLLDDTTTKTKIGTVRIGLALDEQQRPKFVLTLHDVVLPGSGHHDLLDLSSPGAALSQAGSVVTNALGLALDGFGDVGALLKEILGIDPPAGVTPLSATTLLADPLGAIKGYWLALLDNDLAMAQVLRTVRHLLTGTLAAVPGEGTDVSPWRVDLAGGVGLRVWHEGHILVVAVGADVVTGIPGDLAVATTAELTLLRLDLDAGHASFATRASAQVLLRPAGVDPIDLDLDVGTIHFSGVGVRVLWAPGVGLRAVVLGDGLTLSFVDPHTQLPVAHGIPLPVVDADGTVRFAPDWDAVEGIVATLLARANSAVVNTMLDLLGWRGVGAHLRLSALIENPADAVESWATAVALDCAHLSTALGPVTWLLSGGRLAEPLGGGRPDNPYRAPIAGERRAPGLTAWTVPGCPPTRSLTGENPAILSDLRDGIQVPDGPRIAAALASVAGALPELEDLLVGRSRLGDGLTSVLGRWAGTDGVVSAPTTVPSDVTVEVFEGFAYAELVASGRLRTRILDSVAAPLKAVVHVGCSADWLTGVASVSAVDATVASPAAIPDEDGEWFARLPTPTAAADARPDHDGVAGQTAALTAVLAGRTGKVVLVAYGAAGPAALRAAAAQSQVSTVVTVGTPWSTISVLALQTGLGGDALRFLDRLVPEPMPTATDTALAHACTPAQRAWSMVRRGLETTGPSALPNAGAEARRPGLAVHAVFGALSADDAAEALADLVVGGVEARSLMVEATALTTSGPPDELHVGLDVPVLDINLGGLFVSVGAAIDLVSVNATTPRIRPLREVITTVRIGVTDGWLLGGPGAAQNDLELRWMEARVHVPLDGRPGTSELVLHDAHAFTAYRERWVVNAAGTGGATTALPEVKILLREVATRLKSSSSPPGSPSKTSSDHLVDLLTALGILRSGGLDGHEIGLDGDAIDHLLFDPVSTLRPRVVGHATEVATSLRALIGLPTTTTTGLGPTVVRVGSGGLYVDLDLATGTISGATTVTVEGLPPLDLALSASTGAATATFVLGTIDPRAGGIRLVGHAGTGGATLAVENRAPGATATTTVGLHPAVDKAGLLALARIAVPAVVIQAVGSYVRADASDKASVIIDTALDAIGLLAPPAVNGGRDLILPIGLIADPGQWLRLRSDPFGAVQAVLEALVPLVVPTRPAGVPGWPLSDELTVTYPVVDGNLRLAAAVNLSTVIDGRPIATTISGGLSIARTGVVAPILDASVLVDQTGLRLQLTPEPVLSLIRKTPATPIRIYPPGPGIGQAVVAGAGAGAESAVRIALNALLGKRSETTPAGRVGRAVHELGVGLDLLGVDDLFDAVKITDFADNPASALLDRLPNLVRNGLTALTQALDPGLVPTKVKVATAPAPDGGLRITFGTGEDFHLDLVGGSTPALEFGCDIELVDGSSKPIGHLVIEKLRLTQTGIQLDVRGGPFEIDVGSMKLYPLVVARAGVKVGGFTRRIGIGVGLDPAGLESVEFRWALDGTPALWSVKRNIDGDELPADSTSSDVALKALGVAVSLASTILTKQLGTVVTTRATNMLQGVVFTGGNRTIDPSFFTNLTSPTALLRRLEVLAWNCATDPRPLSVTIDDAVTIGLTAVKDGLQQHLGLNVSLKEKFNFPTSGVAVALEVDASWINPPVKPGLSIYVLKGLDVNNLEFAPGFSIAGIGMRFRKPSGPLLELGSIALDGIAFHVYAEAGLGVGLAGAGGGVKIQLDGLAVAPGGGAGTNGVANNVMKDVGSASQNNRPTFSPSVAIQKHPGLPLGLTVRAGDPPGPWWLVIQRQLGPLYVDRIGLNTVEAGGKVTEISLLFNGQLSLFGFTAAVDQLMITWNGGDILSITQWSVDLMGLAISADMSGVSLAGGLLKTTDGAGTSYVGMLMGRFAAYGLSVFGGYTNDGAGHASFFLFGAINGPIGGPPAFFLTGIGGGLGINRGLYIPPDISKFGTYPFIQALDPGAKPPAKPMDELHRLSEFFPHQMGSFWFAAGISFTCFSLVDGVAVIAVSFGNGLNIELLGLARMALPRPGAALVSIELALLARFSTSEGLFMIKAQLTDNSWLLNKDVRLTGGFAFATWWKGPLAGQFVLTMGGYHPSFHRAGYPDVPRLGIMWRVSDALVIKGTSYFALTSEALMTGVAVEASLDLGWVWAKVAFSADGIVYFDPFSFEVSAYARISAGIHLKRGPFTFSFSISLGATIKVSGPDFSGRAEFEIGPATVPIEFGSPRKVDPKHLLWNEFTAKYLEDAGAAARALSSITGKGSLPTSTGGATGAPSADGSEKLPFQVFAEFEITFTTTIPTSTFDVGDGPVAVPTTLSNGQPALLGLSPMGAHDLASTVTIRLDWYNPATKAYQRVDERLAARLVEDFGAGAGRPGYSSDMYPVGVWGTPVDPSIPVKPLPQGDVLSAGKQVRLVAGVDMPSVCLAIDYHQIRAGDRRPLPLLATGNQRRDFLNVAKALPAVDARSAAEALSQAAKQLFADRVVDGTVTARGGHSALAAASFVQDRSAPPLFGTLTDGLAKANGASGERTVLPHGAPFRARPMRAPFVAGYLTGGAGAAQRPEVTTVSNDRLKRRQAPTVESVRGRLAPHLPTTLVQASAPAVAAGGTLIASGLAPRTDAPGSMRSYAGGRVGAAPLQGLVTGLSAGGWTPKRASRRSLARAAAMADSIGSTVRSGDLVVLQLPDSAIDVDEQRRPSVRVSGRARVTMVLGRTVLTDVAVTDGTVTVPRAVTHIGIQADGGVQVTGGYAGWHDRARVARIGAQAALAAGCVVSADAAGTGPVLQWDTAGSVVDGAGEVTTRFVTPVTTMAVALTGTSPTSITPTQLHLVGASVATDRTGAQHPPVAVTLGDTSVLVYAVVPDKDATSMGVTVVAGADWVVSGVVGTNDPVADVARLIARKRLSGVTAKLLAPTGPGCQVEWRAAPAPAPARAPRRARKAPR